jgi:hypothetical protein
LLALLFIIGNFGGHSDEKIYDFQDRTQITAAVMGEEWRERVKNGENRRRGELQQQSAKRHLYTCLCCWMPSAMLAGRGHAMMRDGQARRKEGRDQEK